MQCPRCGLQNQPGITACARCGLPVPKAPGPGRPPGADQGQGQGQGGQGQGQGHGQGHGQGQGQGRHQGPQQGQPAPYRPPSGAGQQGPYGSPSGQQGQGSYGAPGQYSPPAHEQQPAGYPQGQGYGRGQQAYGPPPGSHAPGYGQGQQTYGGQGPYAGTPDRPVYQGGATPSSAWPITNRSDPAARDSGGTATVVALATGVLLALVYAVWAFTARRGIFADFSDGNPVTSDDAKSSDTLDTILLIVAGLVVVIAVAMWVMRMVNDKTSGAGLDIGGLVVTGVGVVVVLVGLFLSSKISDGADQAAQGDKGVTATLVTGGGFLVIAIGLAIGLAAMRAPRRTVAASGHRQQGAYGTR